MTQFDPSILPDPPKIIPDELRSMSVDNTGADWSARVPAAAVGMFVAAVAQWLSHPRFGTKVRVDTSEAGWVLTIDLPVPDLRDDLILPE